MDLTTRASTLAPFRLDRVLLVALVVLALIGAAILFVGSRQPPLPVPFGPAANGVILYSADGDIYAADPDGSDPRVVVGGPGKDIAVLASRDGTRILIARLVATQRVELLVADVDGSDVRALTNEPFLDLFFADWSPDGTRVAVLDRSQHTMSILSVDGGEKIEIDRPGLKAEEVWWRPDGRELVFRGVAPNTDFSGLYTVQANGTGIDDIVPQTFNDGPPFAALSPDGERIIFTQWDGDEYPGADLYVVDVDTGEKRLLEFDGDVESDYFAHWSPDGTRIVFNQGTAPDHYYLAVAPAEGGHATRLGAVMQWDAMADTAFSPDGSKVIARYASGGTWIFDVTDGSGRQLLAPIPILPSWQRIAP